MSPPDYPLFAEALTQLAEALGAKPVGQAGLAVWIQTLKEFPFPDIRAQLDLTARRSTKFPAPAQIFEPLNAARADRIEQKAKVDLIHERKDAEAAFKRSDKLGAMLRSISKRVTAELERDPKEWAEVIWQRFVADRPNPPRGGASLAQRVVSWGGVEYATVPESSEGTPISMIQLQFAATALHRTVEQANAERNERRAEKQAA